MCVRQAVCLSCTMLPRHQVHTGICHTGSAQLHSPHYPLWTRTDVISLSVSLPPALLPSLCLSLASSFSLLLFYLSVYLNLILFLSFLFMPPPPPTVLHGLSILCLSARGLIGLPLLLLGDRAHSSRMVWWVRVARGNMEWGGGGRWDRGVLKGKRRHPAIR